MSAAHFGKLVVVSNVECSFPLNLPLNTIAYIHEDKGLKETNYKIL